MCNHPSFRIDPIPPDSVLSPCLSISQTSELDTATFAGGCFWCVEAPFEHYHGIVDVISGSNEKIVESFILVNLEITSSSSFLEKNHFETAKSADLK